MAISIRSSGPELPTETAAAGGETGVGGPAGMPTSGRSRLRRRMARARQSRVLRRLARNRAALVAGSFLALLVLVAIFAPLVAPREPNKLGIDALASPGWGHLLGTDALARDTLSRLIYSTRVTLLASVEAVGISVMIGVPLGLLAGYLTGAVDAVLSRIFDALLSLPPLVFAMAVIGILGPGLSNAMLSVGLVMAPRFYRVARVSTEAVRHEGYVEACRAIGVPTRRILWRHVIPNASGPLLVQASFAAGLAISAEASLSFLGLGVQLPNASWGSMFRGAFDSVSRNSFQLVPPGVMIVLTVLAMFVLGDAVRDALGRSSNGD